MVQDNPSTNEVAADTMMIVHLRSGDAGLESMRQQFVHNNPGYDLDYIRASQKIEATQRHQVAFMQEGGGTATLSSGSSSKVSVGDVIILAPGISMQMDSAMDLLIFQSPHAPNDNIPAFIRPDWDPNITDVPGGCATETNAYRRILLTWLDHVGTYLYQAINAHRVRIMDSFTHYHPKEGGFDEFYLVQMVMPGAKLITGNQVNLIENYEHLDPESLKGLLQETPLQVGDLVYLPRGVVHRGLGGVLTQVITVPGFVPTAEIGVDYHLKKINERYQLSGADSLPYHAGATERIVIK